MPCHSWCYSLPDKSSLCFFRAHFVDVSDCENFCAKQLGNRKKAGSSHDVTSCLSPTRSESNLSKIAICRRIRGACVVRCTNPRVAASIYRHENSYFGLECVLPKKNFSEQAPCLKQVFLRDVPPGVSVDGARVKPRLFPSRDDNT